MGHSVAAASTVLAAFMAGLAGGAWIAGRVSIPAPKRLQVYAILEFSIAVMALGLSAALHAFFPVLRWAYSDGDAPIQFALVRLVISFVLLAIPAAAMGATFPVVAAWFAGLGSSNKPDSRGKSAADAGLLYATNSAGAAAGAILAGFWAIPAIGFTGTIWLGVSLNVTAALGALWLSTKQGSETPADRAGMDGKAESTKVRPKQPAAMRAAVLPRLGLACSVVALSGFVALAFEVAWTRLLELVIGPTTFAFTTMAVSFVSGIAIGSAVGSRLARRTERAPVLLAAALICIGIGGALAGWFTSSRMPLLVAAQVASHDVVFSSLLFHEFLGVAALLLPMTFALGATFPLALALASSGINSIALDTSRIYVANTLGAIAGALAGAFLLIPRLGLEGTFVQLSRAAITGGGLCAIFSLASGASIARDRVRIVVIAATAGLLAIAVGFPGWDHEILGSGAYLYARSIPADELDAALRAGTIQYYRDGAAATVSVRRLAGSLSLTIDGKTDGSNGADMLTQRLLGLLPALLQGHANDACIIGLGTGVTASSLLATGRVQHADIVEISPEVAQASNLFSKENDNVLKRPQVRLIVGDGRSHLLLTRQQYDVIVSEPSNPWMAGVAALFTREFFEAARARLKFDGVFCQWVHMYDIRAVDLQSIVHTFATVFPQGTLWRIDDGDLLLIGGTGPSIESRLANIRESWSSGSIPAAFRDVEVRGPEAPFELLSLYAGGPTELVRYGDDAPIQTDDRLALEFTAPLGIYGSSTQANMTALRALTASAHMPDAVTAAIGSATGDSWTLRGQMALRANSFQMAYDSFQRAVAMDGHNVQALRGASEAAAGNQNLQGERDWLQNLAFPNAETKAELSHVMAAMGDFESAVASASDAAMMAPRKPDGLDQLASIFADVGDADRLEAVTQRLIQQFPEQKESRYYAATVLFLRGRLKEAAEAARQLLAQYPDYSKAQNLLGAAYAAGGQTDLARSAFEESVRLNPRDPSAYTNLGVLYLNTADPARAFNYFAEALVLDPSSVQAKEGVAQSRSLGSK